MPCTYTGSLQGDEILSLSKTVENLKRELDSLTAMLCAICNYYEYCHGGTETQDFLFDAAAHKGLDADKIWDWFFDHKLRDAEREERELYERLKKKYG